MALTLQKGGNLSLSKQDPNLKRLVVGLGWDARSTDGQDFDLDASAFLISSAGRVRSDADFIQVTAYIRKSIHREVKIALLKSGQDQDFSELVDALLEGWVKSRM